MAVVLILNLAFGIFLTFGVRAAGWSVVEDAVDGERKKNIKKLQKKFFPVLNFWNVSILCSYLGTETPQNGIYMFTIIDFSVASTSSTVIALTQIIAFAYIYGMNFYILNYLFIFIFFIPFSHYYPPHHNPHSHHHYHRLCHSHHHYHHHPFHHHHLPHHHHHFYHYSRKQQTNRKCPSNVWPERGGLVEVLLVGTDSTLRRCWCL